MILMLQLSFSKNIILILIDPKKISIMSAVCDSGQNVHDI